jgi:hypothetical protein
MEEEEGSQSGSDEEIETMSVAVDTSESICKNIIE